MDVATGWFRRRLAGAVSVAVFVLVFVFIDCLGYAASFVLIRLHPAAVPDHLCMAYPVPGADGEQRYLPICWQGYQGAERSQRVKTFRLPETSGVFPLKGRFVPFRVLEDDGTRQLVEVDYGGGLGLKLLSGYQYASRYEAYVDRVVPVAHYGSGIAWVVVFFVGIAFAVLVARVTAAGVRRVRRSPQHS